MKTSDDKSTFERAWRQFVLEDEHVVLPGDLSKRTLLTVQRQVPGRLRGRRRRIGDVAIASVAVLAAVLAAIGLADVPGRFTRDADTVVRSGAVPESIALEHAVPLAPPVVTLAADPIGETETIQILRVRVPRTTLVSAGLLIGGTDLDGVVDVDLLVGDDGLPRGIRGIHLVVE